jgi:hypothetical protein
MNNVSIGGLFGFLVFMLFAIAFDSFRDGILRDKNSL